MISYKKCNLYGAARRASIDARWSPEEQQELSKIAQAEPIITEDFKMTYPPEYDLLMQKSFGSGKNVSMKGSQVWFHFAENSSNGFNVGRI